MLERLRAMRRRRLRQARLDELLREWRSLVARMPAAAPVPAPVRRLVVLPADPATVNGSRGDEAMLCATVQTVRRYSPELVVAVLANGEKADAAVRALGLQPLGGWRDGGSLTELLAAIEGFGADGLAVMGADVMDGCYDVLRSARFALIADLAARRGLRSTILGFSFNRAPTASLAAVFDALGTAARVHVRDGLSIERFRRFTGAQATLVADSAFLLKPAPPNERLEAVHAWAARRREAGDRVLGFNTHNKLYGIASEAQAAAQLGPLAELLGELSSSCNVSWLMLAHDFRDISHDNMCLRPLAAALRERLGERLLYPQSDWSSAEIKALCGDIDGVVTGRMHLAIASLGRGTPVACQTYQDKFHGLFDHFDLPRELLVEDDAGLDTEQFGALLRGFIDSLPALREQISRKLPDVESLAARNFDVLVR